ncbi:MAG: type secretion system family protein [Pedosphaera sp.]|nr:type secretion system family protein [Pedosphaera sp.]
MSTFTYTAVDQQGKETKGTIQVADQSAAIQRIKEMGFYPTRVTEVTKPLTPADRTQRHANRLGLTSNPARMKAALRPRMRLQIFPARIKTKHLCVFTRQLSTALDAGMPLLRCLRLLEEQENNPSLKSLIGEIGASIEGGSTFSEALAQHPRTFNPLYLSMVKAGELGGALEISLKRLSEFMEKTEKIKGKVIAALFYPVAVIIVASGVMAVMLIFVVPKFKEVFASMMNGRPLPAFTRLVLGISEGVKSHFLPVAAVITTFAIILAFTIRTRAGRTCFDRLKLRLPIFGPLLCKLAIARFTRTLGTLTTSGVPILQALTIVKETAGNVILSRAIEGIHKNVKQGETITAPLRQSGIFPVMVVGMIDVGEQTGALPEMLNKIADNYDDEVDNSVSALMSLLEPIMIVLLAIVVGSIVIAMFLPILDLINNGFGPTDSGNI